MPLPTKILSFVIGAAVLTGCASSQIKARKEQREKIAQSSHLYCDFVNGEVFPDVDVELNLEIAKHCENNKNMTITNYRSPSDAIGIVYCCALREDAFKGENSKSEKH
jgi:hypothetical protein